MTADDPTTAPSARHAYFPDELEDTSAFGYAHCVSAGPLLFLAGQCGLGDDHEVVSLDFDVQARQALERVRLILAAAGAGLDDVVSMTVYVTDVRLARRFTSLRRDYFRPPYPASALVEVGKLVPAGAQIEIQAVAYAPRQWGGAQNRARLEFCHAEDASLPGHRSRQHTARSSPAP